MSSDDLQILEQHCSFLSGLKKAELQQLIDESESVFVPAGDAIAELGDTVEHVWIVLEGGVAVLVQRDWGEPRIVDAIEIGGVIGDVELLTGDKGVADFRVLRDSRLLRLNQNTFQRLFLEHPNIWQKMSELADKRTYRLLMTRQINALFGTARMKIADPLLRLEAEEDWLNFEQEILEQLEEQIDWIKIKRGDYLFREGDDADGAYVLVSGRMSVRIADKHGADHQIAQIGQGEIVGEMALIMDAPRTASIVALRDSELFRLSPDVLAMVMQRYPKRLVTVYRTITEQFYNTASGARSASRTSSVAFMADSNDVPMDSFIRALLSEMPPDAEVVHLTRESVDISLGRPGVADSDEYDLKNARLVQWLNGREVSSDLVIFQSESRSPNWNSRCLRQSDVAFKVALADDEPDITSVARQPGDSLHDWHLILIHPEGTDRPRNSAAWTADKNFKAIYHVRLNNHQDMARLARIVSGNAVSLVLGGGGARGFAHIGVLKVLDELGIDVDMIGSTSIGAPIAGWVAQDHDADAILGLAVNAFRSLIDITLPITSVISGKRISSVIKKETGDWDIEDYWRPFFCASTNLTTLKSKIHRHGNSAHAIRASVSIPGVLPPVPDQGDLLVDGGVLNNLPIDVMRGMNPHGVIIAIDVVAGTGIAAREDYGHSVSGWRRLIGKLMPWWAAPKAPAIADILTQSMMLGSSSARDKMLQQGLADYYQNIEVAGVGLLQFDAVKKAATIGYEQSIEPLSEFVASFKRNRGQTTFPID